ncbi:MAG TPA: hypothetical protein VMQ93_04975 [Novosphingobium sp.]|nr:hypothetical protein [Novosphingobium sp.]
MGRYVQDAFAGRGESRWCWLNEMEFAEKAHVLKMLARELGQDTSPAIDELAQHGLDAALGVLSVASGGNVGEAYLRHRALWRAGQSLA